MKASDLISKFFRNQDGQVVVWQTPNSLLIGWFVVTIAAKFMHPGRLTAGLRQLSSWLLFTWAYLEVTKGQSYFRRTLGVAVMVGIVMTYIAGLKG